MLRLITSADRRLAAISNVVARARRILEEQVEHRLARAASGTFFTSRSAIDAKGTAVSRMRTDDVGGQALERQQVRELAVAR